VAAGVAHTFHSLEKEFILVDVVGEIIGRFFGARRLQEHVKGDSVHSGIIETVEQDSQLVTLEGGSRLILIAPVIVVVEKHEGSVFGVDRAAAFPAHLLLIEGVAPVGESVALTQLVPEVRSQGEHEGEAQPVTPALAHNGARRFLADCRNPLGDG
jgi:hypothetical protein